MDYPHLKGFEKHPHPATKTKEPKTYHPRLAKRRLVTSNTDTKEEGTREDEQAEEDGLGREESDMWIWPTKVQGS